MSFFIKRNPFETSPKMADFIPQQINKCFIWLTLSDGTMSGCMARPFILLTDSWSCISFSLFAQNCSSPSSTHSPSKDTDRNKDACSSQWMCNKTVELFCALRDMIISSELKDSKTFKKIQRSSTLGEFCLQTKNCHSENRVLSWQQMQHSMLARSFQIPV